MSAKSEIMNQLQSLQSSADLKVMIDSPDVYICTVAMNSIQFFEGKGDRTSFFEMILALDPK